MKISKILIPTDFSDFSLHALKYAKDLVGVFQAQLHCIHVVDEAYQYWTTMGPESAPVGVAIENLTGVAEEYMQRFSDEHLVGLHYAAVTKVVVGQPFREIIAYAREASIDLIVICTHGRSALTSMIIGSTAEKVVRKSPCPVLTVRHPEHGFEMP
jgi:nucleotide-binding universal stress UspA family protein